MSQLPKILMLYTGGTIGMVQDVMSKRLIPFDFQHLLNKIPDIAELPGEIDSDSLDKPIDSSDIKPEHWLRLANRIRKGIETYDGFVILHGSDTMAYTASALSFLLHDLEKSVILTGSQLPIGVPRSDARENLITALELAMHQTNGAPTIKEVCIYFEYDLLRGNRTHKISAEDFDAFQSLNYPKLAEAGVHIKVRNNYLLQHRALGFKGLVPEISAQVNVLTVFPGMQENYVRVLLAQDVKATVIRTFGSGNAPTDKWFIALISEAIQNGMYIINVSQCNGGSVQLGKYEASEAMLEMGVISAGDMTFEAALTKTMYLLAQDISAQQFKTLFEQNLAGELTD